MCMLFPPLLSSVLELFEFGFPLMSLRLLPINQTEPWMFEVPQPLIMRTTVISELLQSGGRVAALVNVLSVSRQIQKQRGGLSWTQSDAECVSGAADCSS